MSTRNIFASAQLDGYGVQGQIFVLSMICVFTFGALAIILYCWRKGLLTLSEEPSLQMMNQDEEGREND